MNIIEKRKIFLTISAILIVISIVMLFVRGLNLSIDFTGGSRLELAKDFDGEVLNKESIENIYNDEKIKIHSECVIEACINMSKNTELNQDVFIIAGWIQKVPIKRQVHKCTA